MNVLTPEWPAPPNVRAVITTRIGGLSQGAYAGLNLGDHVGDDPVAVAGNRALLRDRLGLPAEPHWLTQVHGCRVTSTDDASPGCEADGVCADLPGRVCAVLTADCLPLLICDRQGERVCAVHAGWRGLAAGVIEAALRRLDRPPADLLVWLGPAIGPRAFEVGDEVRQAFIRQSSAAEAAFEPSRSGHWLADLYALARQRLTRLGAGFVGGGDYCTVTDRERFYSYRRDGVTGRMASLIWLQA
ncbi:MAG: peptidoglycan editing factor PgeF [Gammaproteobacteria bacterium]|nr:peptidoglycan editing factor PgeF [Gammaproteobacteria bacterium]